MCTDILTLTLFPEGNFGRFPVFRLTRYTQRPNEKQEHVPLFQTRAESPFHDTFASVLHRHLHLKVWVAARFAVTALCPSHMRPRPRSDASTKAWFDSSSITTDVMFKKQKLRGWGGIDEGRHVHQRGIKKQGHPMKVPQSHPALFHIYCSEREMQVTRLFFSERLWVWFKTFSKVRVKKKLNQLRWICTLCLRSGPPPS